MRDSFIAILLYGARLDTIEEILIDKKICTEEEFNKIFNKNIREALNFYKEKKDE